MARKNKNTNNKFAYEKDIPTNLYRIKAINDIYNKQIGIFIPKNTLGGNYLPPIIAI